MAEADYSPSKIPQDDLIETCLILVQQLFSEQRINDQERDKLKGKRAAITTVLSSKEEPKQTGGSREVVTALRWSIKRQ